MREHGVGVGDLGEVPGRHGISGHSSGCDDDRAAERECNAGILSGRIRAECNASTQPFEHGIDLSDGARVEHGAFDLHRPSSGGTDRMRVDRVGIRDLGEVPCGAWGTRHSSSGDDSRRARRQ